MSSKKPSSRKPNKKLTLDPSSKIPYFASKTLFEIKGKYKKYVPPTETKESKRFLSIKIKHQPDTRRVFSLDYITENEVYNRNKRYDPSQKTQNRINPITQKPINPIPSPNNPIRTSYVLPPRAKSACSKKNSKFNTESSDFNYISNVDYNIKSRPVNVYGRETYNFNNKIANTEGNLSNDNDNECNNNAGHSFRTVVERRNNKATPFNNYSTTTQITLLPGGVKRNDNEINDNQMELNKVLSQKNGRFQRVSYKIKEQNDYKTNVYCLPGCRYNDNSNCGEKKNKKIFKENLVKSDIFNTENNNGNNFNRTWKKVFPQKISIEDCNNNTFRSIKRRNKNDSHFQFI